MGSSQREGHETTFCKPLNDLRRQQSKGCEHAEQRKKRLAIRCRLLTKLTPFTQKKLVSDASGTLFTLI